MEVRQRTSPLDRILDKRVEKKLKTINPQIEKTLTELRRAGVNVEIFGSMARGDFRIHSDVDFLVTDKSNLSETDIFNIISDNMNGTPFDVVFAENLQQKTVKLMRFDAHAR